MKGDFYLADKDKADALVRSINAASPEGGKGYLTPVTDGFIVSYECPDIKSDDPIGAYYDLVRWVLQIGG